MIDSSVVKNLFLDMLKFMISVIALCWGSSYFLTVVYSYAIEGYPLLAAIKYNFTPMYLLWVVGLAVWLKIEEKGLAFATALILFTSDYFGRLLGYRMFEHSPMGVCLLENSRLGTQHLCKQYLTHKAGCKLKKQ